VGHMGLVTTVFSEPQAGHLILEPGQPQSFLNSWPQLRHFILGETSPPGTLTFGVLPHRIHYQQVLYPLWY